MTLWEVCKVRVVIDDFIFYGTKKNLDFEELIEFVLNYK